MAEIKPSVKQFEGSFRLWKKDLAGALTPTIPNPDDITGNHPVEANAAIFSYADGDEVNIKSKQRGRYEQIIYTNKKPGDSSLSLTLLGIPGALLARLFYGDDAVTTVSTGTATNEEVVMTLLDTPYGLTKRFLSAAPVVKDGATGLVTYVEGTDYEVDLRRGLIAAKTGGDITAADTVKVTYTYDTYSVQEIRGGVKPQETYYITGDLLNRPDGQDLGIEIYEAVLGNDGDVDLFDDAPITCTLKGNLVTPSDKTSPYTVRAYTHA